MAQPLVPLLTPEDKTNYFQMYRLTGSPVVLCESSHWEGGNHTYTYTYKHGICQENPKDIRDFSVVDFSGRNGYNPVRVVVKSYTPLSQQVPLLIGNQRLEFVSQLPRREFWGQPSPVYSHDAINWFGLAPKQRIEYEVWVNDQLDGTYRAEIEPTIRGKAIEIVGSELRVQLTPELGGGVVAIPRVTTPGANRSEPSQLMDRTANTLRSVLGYHAANLYDSAIRNDIEFDDELLVRTVWLFQTTDETPDTKGLHKYRNLIEQMRQDDLCRAFLDIHTDSSTSGGTTNNKMLSKFFEKMGSDLAAIRAKIVEVGSELLHSGDYYTSYTRHYEPRKLLVKLPGVAEQIQADLEKKDWTKRKNAEDRAKGLLPEPDRTPKLFEAIAQGKISTTVFHQPSDNSKIQQPVNREFDLIEESLSQDGWYDTVCEVAASAAGRSTYERDFTSWLAFMLYTLPAYLNHHAPRPDGTSWRCMPKFVQSSWELEMSDTDENGTTKRRSAMTPVADNETGIVTVPYVAVRVAGAVTQFCYSRHFHLFQRGFLDPISNGIVTRDLELDLNGRDDYGLMYFTLNGTSTATGYPTFLIIFERKLRGTTVHFHRVRPCRTVNGVLTPANELIKACYKYMAGNVAADQIVAQQGDIMVIKVPETESGRNNPIQNGAKIDESATQNGPAITFESHKFVGPLSFFRSAAKTPDNRLGFIYAPEGLHLEHPEHDHTERLGAGWYEIRRAKSYENNPVGIWSLTID